MKFEHLLVQMKERMPEKRYIHTKGVADDSNTFSKKIW